MKRPKLSNDKKAQMLEHLNTQRALKAEEKKAFNKQFRKSPLFISSLIIRITFVVFLITAFSLHHNTATINEEILAERHIKRDSSFQTQTEVISTIYLRTNKGQYKGDISNLSIPGFDVGDTLLIQKNLFGKPTFFTMKHWPYKYELDYGLEAYYIVLFLTLVSMGFNDGQDKFTKKILWSFMLIDLITILCFFLI